jgi:hypothetical protein
VPGKDNGIQQSGSIMAPATSAPPLARSAASAAPSTLPGILPRTKSGRIKRRFSWTEKVKILDPTAPAELTERRLEQFQKLFAFRRTDAIITRVAKGHRGWTALRCPLGMSQIVRHLLGAQIPTLLPQWVGARSFETSLYFCLDIDVDRSPPPDPDLSGQWGEVVGDENDPLNDPVNDPLVAADVAGGVGLDIAAGVAHSDHRRDDRDHSVEIDQTDPPVPQGSKPSRPSFPERCQTVEAALRRLGINPDNPRQVLKTPSPSGGRHYYIFLDAPAFLYQLQSLLEAAGLEFVSGQIEFFPSTTHALRLPFGHQPNGPNDPQAWIRFIDAYHQKRIKRFSLQSLYENLSAQSCSTSPSPPRNVAITNGKAVKDPNDQAVKNWDAKTGVIKEGTNTVVGNSVVGTNPVRVGSPRRFSSPVTASVPVTTAIAERYAHLVANGPTSLAEAEELFELGILTFGTRTAVLKHLASHLIFIRGRSADEAGAQLIAWAMNLRHRSKDIQQDLARGTHVVPKQIERLCQWYEKKRDPTRTMAKHGPNGFAAAEIAALRSYVQRLPIPEQATQADFLLHFLYFAKRHGKPAPDNSGLEASPSVKEVIRGWPGCSHMLYKERIETAKGLGLLHLVKGKWQNPNGKGRARTWKIAVPSVPQTGTVLNYDEARALLLDPALGALGDQLSPGNVVTEAAITERPPHQTNEKQSHDPDNDHHNVNHDHTPQPHGSHNQLDAHRRIQPAVVREARPRIDLAESSRERSTEPAPVAGLRGPNPGKIGTGPDQPGSAKKVFVNSMSDLFQNLLSAGRVRDISSIIALLAFRAVRSPRCAAFVVFFASGSSISEGAID